MIKEARQPKSKPFRISVSHERVLEALGRYDRLTAEQVRRLLFGPGAITRAQTRLKELADHGYALRVAVGRSGSAGSGPFVYTLDRRGRAHLMSLGIDVPRRLRQSEERERSSPHLRHSIAVVDVLILGELLCRAQPIVSIARMLGERALKAAPVAVTLSNGTNRGVAVDGWLDLRIRHPEANEQLCLAFEVDRGTEWQTAWRRKVAALLAFESEPYARFFGVDLLIIVVVAPTEARATQLRHWTMQELTEQHAEARVDLFRFGVMPDDLTDAQSFFLAPCWSIPGQDGMTPLIAGVGEPGGIDRSY